MFFRYKTENLILPKRNFDLTVLQEKSYENCLCHCCCPHADVSLQNVYHSECAIVSMLIHGFLFYKSHQNFQINLVFDWSESFSMHARFQIKRYLHDTSYDSCYCCTFHEKYDLMSSFISSINYCSFEFGSEFQSVHLCL